MKKNAAKKTRGGSEDESNLPLFPTIISLVIFVAYIALFVSQGLLVTASKNAHDNYDFNTVLVVLNTEALKLFICVVWFLRIRPSTTCSDLFDELFSNWFLALLYLIPSFLYCLYNNLTFISYQAFDPTSYNCIMQFRIVLTAIIYQSLFRRRLTYVQWSSLCLLTVGCLLKQYGRVVDSHHQSMNKTKQHSFNETRHLNHTTIASVYQQDNELDHMLLSDVFNVHLLILLFQMFCSCLAGVYNEYLLKRTGKDVDIIIQNIFMYLDSIVCNLALLILAPKLYQDSKKSDVGNEQNVIGQLLTPLVLTITVNNAMSGIITAFFLKNLNSILKTYASALELFAIALLAWLLFGTRVDIYTSIALLFVSVAMIIYARNPVSVAPPNLHRLDDGSTAGRKMRRSRGSHPTTSLIMSDSEDTDDDDEDDEIDLYSYKFKVPETNTDQVISNDLENDVNNVRFMTTN